MAKLDSLTGWGAMRVMLSVFEGMGRSMKEEREGNRSGERSGVGMVVFREMSLVVILPSVSIPAKHVN
jgi:hypothetical protein